MLTKYFDIPEEFLPVATKQARTRKKKDTTAMKQENITQQNIESENITQQTVENVKNESDSKENVFIKGYILLFEREKGKLKKILLNKYETKILKAILQGYDGNSKELKKIKSALQGLTNFTKIELNAKECVELYSYLKGELNESD